MSVNVARNVPVAVVGATTWGTTLAIKLASNGALVGLLARDKPEAEELDSHRQNQRFLPGVDFPNPLAVAGDVEPLIPYAGLVIIAVPSDRFRENIRRIAGAVADGATILSVALMLRYSLGLTEEAASIERAVEQVLDSGAGTPDIFAVGAQQVSTAEMGDRVVSALE